VELYWFWTDKMHRWEVSRSVISEKYEAFQRKYSRRKIFRKILFYKEVGEKLIWVSYKVNYETIFVLQYRISSKKKSMNCTRYQWVRTCRKSKVFENALLKHAVYLLGRWAFQKFFPRRERTCRAQMRRACWEIVWELLHYRD